ncbi:DPEP2 neighbor protein-like [Sciurus carolinensis]|uniref:DPEP2 neighbor protein-like n=1 Tax=Sciurus carolinensis TaxID=30640 RepID=UPI001FB2857F|nr:DPEP2 neighbor protein-like [Sciurus carolinensis]
MSDWIYYIQSNLSSVSWGSSAAAAVPPASPTPAYYHVLYQGCAETQVGWHGETYCLVGGYRLYGDAPLATPAKDKIERPAEKPAEKPNQRARGAPKKRRAPSEAEKTLGCRGPKIRRLVHTEKRQRPRKLAG